MKRACVIGWPVSHSLSPVIHGFWLKEYGLQGEYVRAAVEPKDFESFFVNLAANGFCGANVTIPYKLEAFRLCQETDDAARTIGAVNTVWFEGDELMGSNTDAYGFLANLDRECPGWDRGPSAVMIGAGGAARAILWALGRRRFTDIRIVNRTKARAAELASSAVQSRAFGLEEAKAALDGVSFVVNASTLGMAGAPPLVIDLSCIPRTAAVCDIVYYPLETALLRQAREKGLAAVDGLGMLLHQAIPGFEKWFGVRPRVTPALRKAVLTAAIAGRT